MTNRNDPRTIAREIWLQNEIDALRAENARLSKALDELQDLCQQQIMIMSDDQVVAASVAAHHSALKSVEAVHQTQITILNAIIESYKRERKRRSDLLRDFTFAIRLRKLKRASPLALISPLATARLLQAAADLLDKEME